MIGIDVVSIERIAEKIKTPSFINGVFTTSEINYYKQKGEKAETLAGIFAAKEAVVKALKVGLVFRPTYIEICHEVSGMPYVVLYNNAKEVITEKFGTLPHLHISISHDGGVAVAVCIIC
ncbi:MAG: holo-ACP synthase [Firmicutes bacterium]|nr:holo-ACP synthase [Bacillota bacterium]